MSRSRKFMIISLGAIMGLFASSMVKAATAEDVRMATIVCTRDEPNTAKNYPSREACIRDWSANFAKVGDFTGKWSTDIKRCRRFSPYEEGFAEITKRKAVFYESSCTIKSARPGKYGKALVFDVKASCDAEGEEIASRMVFDADSAGRLVVTDDGTSETYYRCN